MAAAVLGEAFLSAFVDVVFKRLANPEVANFIRGKKLDANLLQRLKNTLYAVEAVLNDAELKQINDSAVNKWLDDLKDAVYVADDLLDRLSTKAATQKEARLASCVPRAPAIRELEIVGSSKVVLEELPDSVEDLSIEGRQVESLLSLKYSQSLTAFNCMSLLAELFPPSLESLELRNCGKLEFPELNQNVLVTSLPLQIFFNLSELTIGDWDNLECVSLEGGIPPSLRSLDIQNCEKLLRSPSLATMDMLTTLCIEGPYDGVKSFPEEGLVLLPRSLTYLEIGLLNSVETLDCNGLLHLTSLQTLTIDDCPKLENMVGEMLPASLIILRIDNCPLLEERH
ncbi:hypothetical protein RJT34_23868 [Clitoria ternatea]|uniref:Disease resistance N-terminal domain-containing protein n=1 Tax=Clitoria ternatea TaxID=43366 RepID=A0AAN9IIS9_CLITE